MARIAHQIKVNVCDSGVRVEKIRVLFNGESWLGSCARSLQEALSRQIGVELDELSEDSWFTKPRARWLRALNRLIGPAYRREFNAQILARVRALRLDVVITYKGDPVCGDLLAATVSSVRLP